HATFSSLYESVAAPPILWRSSVAMIPIKVSPAAAFALSVLCGACASTGATPRPFPMPPPAAIAAPESGVTTALPAQPAADDYALVGTALHLRGIPYKNGGSDPDGF